MSSPIRYPNKQLVLPQKSPQSQPSNTHRDHRSWHPTSENYRSRLSASKNDKKTQKLFFNAAIVQFVAQNHSQKHLTILHHRNSLRQISHQPTFEEPDLLSLNQRHLRIILQKIINRCTKHLRESSSRMNLLSVPEENPRNDNKRIWSWIVWTGIRLLPARMSSLRKVVKVRLLCRHFTKLLKWWRKSASGNSQLLP